MRQRHPARQKRSPAAGGPDVTGEGAVDNTALPLTLLPPGTRARVVSVEGGFGFVRRLAEMGISPGIQVLSLRGGTGGPVIIEVRSSRLVMGRGMAQRVKVTPLR